MSGRVDISSLVAGIGIVVLGLLILLQEEGTIELEAGWLAPALVAAAGAVLVASGAAARNR